MTSSSDWHGDPRFLTTRWSVVLAAGSAPAPAQRAALEDLCAGYWFPLYAFARRRGLDATEASDGVQSFFALLLERDDLRRADPARGRFRAFLATAFRNFLANERERARAGKRGGGRAPISIDAAEAETRFGREPADRRTPESAFERAWASAVIERALSRLQAEQEHAQKGALFAALKPALAAEDDAPANARIAASLSMSENAVKVAAHRLRKRFGELLREEVAGTLERPEEIEAEIRDLFRAFE